MRSFVRRGSGSWKLDVEFEVHVGEVALLSRATNADIAHPRLYQSIPNTASDPIQC